jgi:hypothetical protein
MRKTSIGEGTGCITNYTSGSDLQTMIYEAMQMAG